MSRRIKNPAATALKALGQAMAGLPLAERQRILISALPIVDLAFSISVIATPFVFKPTSMPSSAGSRPDDS